MKVEQIITIGSMGPICNPGNDGLADDTECSSCHAKLNGKKAFLCYYVDEYIPSGVHGGNEFNAYFCQDCMSRAIQSAKRKRRKSYPCRICKHCRAQKPKGMCKKCITEAQARRKF